MIKNLIKDEEGAFLLLTSAIMIIGVIILVFALNFGRYGAIKEQLQTAGDAGSLAGAKTATRYVTLQIIPGDMTESCGDPDHPCCVSCGDAFTVTGKESDLIDNNGWKSYCCSCIGGSSCSMSIIDRDVQFDRVADVENATTDFFQMNLPSTLSPANGGSSSYSVDIHGDRSDPQYPSVIVKAQGQIQTIMMDVLKAFVPNANFSSMNMSTCSQGSTSYRDPFTGKWSTPPNSYCTN